LQIANLEVKASRPLKEIESKTKVQRVATKGKMPNRVKLLRKVVIQSPLINYMLYKTAYLAHETWRPSLETEANDRQREKAAQ